MTSKANEIECQGCGNKGVDRMGEGWNEQNDASSIGRYMVEDHKGKMVKASYCYDCRDAIVEANVRQIESA
jgi:hypothetical protein